MPFANDSSETVIGESLGFLMKKGTFMINKKLLAIAMGALAMGLASCGVKPGTTSEPESETTPATSQETVEIPEEEGKTAIYFEVGEFYYDKQEDEKALISFLNAKNVLKNSNDTQNTQRIISRIKDIKMRLNSVIFKVITEKYDKQ